MIELPSFKITPGQPASYSFQWRGQDLATATGEVSYVDMDGAEITLGTPAMDVSGNVVLSLTADETALFPMPDRDGMQRVGIFQIVIDGRETFQGRLFAVKVY